MTNKEIAKAFQFLGNIMELHGENPFKIRSYQNAYLTIRKLDRPLSDMSEEEISGLKGIGSAIAGKIRELLDSGQMETLKKYQDLTPPGVQEMLQIKGFGPKKIQSLWKELGVETIGELLYACNENRLVELKGFGQKTQEDLRQKLEYFQKSRGKFLYADLEPEATGLIQYLREKLPGARAGLTGAICRKCNIIEQIEIIIGSDDPIDPVFDDNTLALQSRQDHIFTASTSKETPVKIYAYQLQEYGSKCFRHSAADDFMQAFLKRTPGLKFQGLQDEQEVFAKAGLPYIEPELREQEWSMELAVENKLPVLLEEHDVKGVIHAHSTYSDGINSIREMALYAREKGYRYLGLTDHSKSAFYANGLKEERLVAQWQEIDRLNAELKPFRIFKGIESDILSDGSLDYEEDILRQFDFVIASIHSNLRMDEEKATSRLLKAIENPYTSILGHPTGRLLLSRQGYPIDHRKIIDACADNQVSIELNANPYRLDLDWSWIPYATEKGVFIAVNPDAHSTAGIHDIHFGVLSARKGGLTRENCLNCLDTDEFAKWINRQ